MFRKQNLIGFSVCDCQKITEPGPAVQQSEQNEMLYFVALYIINRGFPCYSGAMMDDGKLTDQDHHDMDRMLERVLDAYKTGHLTRAQVVGGLAHVMAALDIGNTREAVNWFKQDGVSYFGDDA